MTEQKEKSLGPFPLLASSGTRHTYGQRDELKELARVACLVCCSVFSFDEAGSHLGEETPLMRSEEERPKTLLPTPMSGARVGVTSNTPVSLEADFEHRRIKQAVPGLEPLRL